MEPESAKQPEDITVGNLAVFNKYKAAAEVVNAALQMVVTLCVPGADIADICARGDAFIEDQLSRVFNKKRMEKGIAFPTCISVNNICGYFSPLMEESTALEPGQIAKVDLGAHIDGFVSNAATTIVVGASPEAPISGRQADVVLAANTAIEAGVRLMRPGNSNYQVTEMIAKIAQVYNCNPVEGVLSHQLKKHVIDGNKCIINKETIDQRVEEFNFEANEVYCLDVMVSSGEGKPRETDFRTTVYKRDLETTYSLKLRASRAFFAEVNQRFPTLPFTLRAFEDPTGARFGVSDCQKHGLVHGYPVIQEPPSEFVANFKYTVIILPNKTVVANTLPFNAGNFQSEHHVEDEEVLATLAVDLEPKKSKAKAA